jgi:hypothetical protein
MPVARRRPGLLDPFKGQIQANIDREEAALKLAKAGRPRGRRAQTPGADLLDRLDIRRNPPPKKRKRAG